MAGLNAMPDWVPDLEANPHQGPRPMSAGGFGWPFLPGYRSRRNRAAAAAPKAIGVSTPGIPQNNPRTKPGTTPRAPPRAQWTAARPSGPRRRKVQVTLGPRRLPTIAITVSEWEGAVAGAQSPPKSDPQASGRDRALRHPKCRAGREWPRQGPLPPASTAVAAQVASVGAQQQRHCHQASAARRATTPRNAMTIPMRRRRDAR